jgi:hypothetical protein
VEPAAALRFRARCDPATGNLVPRLVQRNDLVTAVAIAVSGKFAGDLLGLDGGGRRLPKDFAFRIVERATIVADVKEEAGHFRSLPGPATTTRTFMVGLQARDCKRFLQTLQQADALPA